MKSILATALAALALAGASAPAAFADLSISTMPALIWSVDDSEVDRRGRGGRSKPRVPGGSGCDDARDLIEHPECRA